MRKYLLVSTKTQKTIGVYIETPERNILLLRKAGNNGCDAYDLNISATALTLLCKKQNFTWDHTANKRLTEEELFALFNAITF